MFRRPIPKRALVAAILGALYSFLLIPIPGAYAYFGVNLAGVAWLLLSIGLLFLQPLSYYAYVTWALLWIVWKGVLAWQARSWLYALDVVLPLVSLALLTASGYLDAAHEAKAQDEGELTP